MSRPTEIIRKFLGIGRSREKKIPVASVIEKQEHCVSIDLKTGEIERYHYHAGDVAIVPPELEFAVGLTSSGKIWVHSYLDWEHAERVACLQRARFWRDKSFTSRFMDPTPDGKADGSLQWYLREDCTETKRYKENIRKGWL